MIVSLLLFDTQIFNLKRQRNQLQETFKTKYPNYYNLIYNHDVVTIKNIQKTLKEDQCLLEYLVGEENIFIFLITKDEYKIKQIKKDFPLKDWVNQLREGIYNYWSMSKTSDRDLEKYDNLYKDRAFKLYQKLIQPIHQNITEKLIIVPDAELNFIPFDALLTKPSIDINIPQELPYFIKHHQISYNYSATLYNQLIQKERSSSKNDVLAFAPKFDNFENNKTVRYAT